MRASGRPVPRNTLIEEVWGEREVTCNNLEVFIRFLRAKLDGAGHPSLIHTERGLGCRLRSPEWTSIRFRPLIMPPSMVIACLPRERIVVNADMYTPPEQGAPLPGPSESARALARIIQRLGLDVAQHVGLHGGVGPHDDLVKIAGQPATF